MKKVETIRRNFIDVELVIKVYLFYSAIWETTPPQPGKTMMLLTQLTVSKISLKTFQRR